jgi:LysM repeat protein
MKNKSIKELISIAAELDSRGLLKEASILDKLAADIISFEERAPALREKRERENPTPEPSEPSEPGRLLEMPEREGFDEDNNADEIEAFLRKNLAPETEIWPSRHEIKSGDTLAGIAKDYGISEEVLLKINKITKDEALDYNLQVGEFLKITEVESDTLADVAYSGSEDLKAYMEEAMPDKLHALAESLGVSGMSEILRLVKNVAVYRPEYELDDDVKYLTDNMFYYLKSYSF